MEYRKIGGIRWVRFWRFGFSFWLYKPDHGYRPRQRPTKQLRLEIGR